MNEIIAALRRIEWHEMHNHELLHAISSDTEDILRALARQPGSMTPEEVAAVTARAQKIHERLAAMAADKPA